MKLLLCVMSLGLSIWPAIAFGQVDTGVVGAREVTVARAEFMAGVEAARESDWATARRHFARSYEINQRPSALYNLAAAQAETGALVEAAASYRELLGRRSEASSEHVSEATRLLGELEARIPTLRLTVEHLTDDDVVLLDGQPLQRALLDRAVPLNPGQHRVAVLRGEAEIAAESLHAAEGAELELRLVAPVAPLPEVAVDEQPLDDPVALEERTDPDSENIIEQWWLWTIIGAVLVGVIAVVAVVATPASAPDSIGFEMTVPLEVP